MAENTTKPPAPELILSSDPFADGNPYEILGLDRNADRAKPAPRSLHCGAVLPPDLGARKLEVRGKRRREAGQ